MRKALVWILVISGIWLLIGILLVGVRLLHFI